MKPMGKAFRCGLPTFRIVTPRGLGVSGFRVEGLGFRGFGVWGLRGLAV